MAFRGRNSRGPRRTGGSYRPHRAGTRRGGSRANKGRTMRRIGIGVGIAGAGLLAINAGILGAAGSSRAIKELANTAGSVRKWAKTRGVRKAAAKASTVAFHASRVRRLKVFRSKTMKFKKTKNFSVRRMVKR